MSQQEEDTSEPYLNPQPQYPLTLNANDQHLRSLQIRAAYLARSLVACKGLHQFETHLEYYSMFATTQLRGQEFFGLVRCGVPAAGHTDSERRLAVGEISSPEPGTI